MIEAGIEAKARVIQCANWLITTMNEALPDGNWTLPNPHPSAIVTQETGNEDDYHFLSNSVDVTPGAVQHIVYIANLDNNHIADSVNQRVVQNRPASTLS